MGYYDSETEDYVYTSYDDIVNRWGYETILEVTDSDYQGDSRFLLRDGGRIGVLQFGWGSCSGCDALQRCDSKSDVDELADDLKEQIRWFGTAGEALDYFNTHDWEGDYSWHEDEQQEFITKAKELLSA